MAKMYAKKYDETSNLLPSFLYKKNVFEARFLQNLPRRGFVEYELTQVSSSSNNKIMDKDARTPMRNFCEAKRRTVSLLKFTGGFSSMTRHTTYPSTT